MDLGTHGIRLHILEVLEVLKAISVICTGCVIYDSVFLNLLHLSSHHHHHHHRHKTFSVVITSNLRTKAHYTVDVIMLR